MNEKIAVRLRQLKELDEAQRQGVHVLEVGDQDTMAAAIEKERELVDEQRKLVDALRGLNAATENSRS
jgi:hypothetical protein